MHTLLRALYLFLVLNVRLKPLPQLLGRARVAQVKEPHSSDVRAVSVVQQRLHLGHCDPQDEQLHEQAEG